MRFKHFTNTFIVGKADFKSKYTINTEHLFILNKLINDIN